MGDPCIGLSVDEWNVWYQTGDRSHERGAEVAFERAPSIAEDTYTLADALDATLPPRSWNVIRTERPGG